MAADEEQEGQQDENACDQRRSSQDALAHLGSTADTHPLTSISGLTDDTSARRDVAVQHRTCGALQRV
jgi:hypothetical protein